MAVAVATTVCLALAFHTVDVDAVGRALGGAKPHYFALAVLLLLGNLLVAMARFRVVLDRFGYVPAWRRLHGAFCVGLIGNLFVLNFIGQSAGRAGALTSSGVPIGVTIIVTLLERVIAAGTLAVAGLCAAWFLLPHFGFEIAQGGAFFLSLVAAMTLAALVVGAVSYRRCAALRIVAAVGRNVARFWSVGLLTVLTHCFMLGGYVAVLLALGLEAATLEIAGAVLMVMFAAALPISVSGWGVRELSALTILGAIGHDPATSLAAAFVVGVLSLGVSLAIALPGLFLALIPDRTVVPDPERSSGSWTRNGKQGHKATGKRSVEHAYGVTSHRPDSASPERLLALNRDHWCVESAHYILDTAFDEDRCRIRTALRTPPDSGASPSASSAPNPTPATPHCESSSETFASSSTI